MALTDIERLRMDLGETIPVGGTENDTLFTDEQMQSFLDAGVPGGYERAVWNGWRAKAAALSDLVDVTDGNASRAFSDLLDHATKMVSMYAHAGTGAVEGRTRIGRIRRCDT
jgi:hypothetical protein